MVIGLISSSDGEGVLAVFTENHAGFGEKKKMTVFEAKTKSLSKFPDARDSSYMNS